MLQCGRIIDRLGSGVKDIAGSRTRSLRAAALWPGRLRVLVFGTGVLLLFGGMGAQFVATF